MPLVILLYLYSLQTEGDSNKKKSVYCHMTKWLQTGFGLVIGFMEHLQNVTRHSLPWPYHCHKCCEMCIALDTVSCSAASQWRGPTTCRLTRNPRPSPQTLPVSASSRHKQRHAINHSNKLYFAEVYCVQNLKHLFKDWISERFSYTDGVRLLILTRFIHLNGGYESCSAGGSVPCGNTGRGL
jgi:hypothetical protein